ncbi:unnamed protein product [Arctogadus glacialis]
MAEVLQICESVHKQVEEQQLMVYQRGDTHTVVSSQPAGPEAAEEEGGSFLVTIQSDGQAVVTHAGVAVVAASDEEGVLVEQALAIEEGETLTVVTHSGQAGAGDSLAVVSACLAMEPPPTDEPAAQDPAVGEETPGQQGASSQDPDPDTATSTEMSRGDVSSGTTSRDVAAAVVETASSLEVVPEEAVAEPEPPPPKRKRGRPAKVKKEVVVMEEEVEPMEETDSLASALPGEEEGSEQTTPTDGVYGQRSIEEEEDKKNLAPPPHPTPAKIPPGKPGRRGRPPKRPLEVSDPSKPDPGADGSEVTATEGEGEEEGGGDASARTKGGPDAEGMLDGEHACSECGMTFQRRYALIMHTLKHEKTRAYKCSLCSKEFQYAASLRAHLARHKQHSGQRALPLKPPAAAAAADLGADQGGDPDDKSGVRTKREFVCDICGKTLPKLYSLRIHMLNHTGVRPHCCKTLGGMNELMAQDVVLQVPTAGESKYLCNICGDTFHRASALSKHTKKHQPKPEVRAFACHTVSTVPLWCWLG